MEILSPASNMKHIQVAIDGKANAVYGGLKKWNARNKAINFSVEEYNNLIDELHKNNIKFFLTLNILMLDEEIEEVISFLKHNKLPDSFIVTDIGLINRLHEEFPSVPLHFSTQFGCHTIDDVNYVETLGGARAILSRELTLEELQNIKNNTKIELECFIWGSQCLSFSGLCFFGTLINGGGGNRGKCIITCRDAYFINNDKGHYLYVPDMDCINLRSKLDNIDCLKLEGRRRHPSEILDILHKINANSKSVKNVGYLFGTNTFQNGLYEKINTRIKPLKKARNIQNINANDICIEYKNGYPVKFSTNYQDDKVMYICTELKKDYQMNKKNLCLDFVFENNIVKEVLYVNHKGDGHTFYGTNYNLTELKSDEIIQSIENKNQSINIYKVKYQKTTNDIYYINKDLVLEIIDYILKDCAIKLCARKQRKFSLNSLYIETQDLNIIERYIDDKFVKIIYDIATISNLENIEKVVKKYNDKIIYKLPLFNWKSENLTPYLKKLNNKEVMFTRFTQLYLCKKLSFKKRYIDYTIYVWNKDTLKYLKTNNIDEFTASPELNYETNKKIYGQEKMQVILCGKLPLVYTRNCFNNTFGCTNCHSNCNVSKKITNVDKNMELEILCNEDFRFILNKMPILNDYSTMAYDSKTKFRYVTLGQDYSTIEKTIKILKQENCLKKLKKDDYWNDSYECNLIEGKE